MAGVLLYGIWPGTSDKLCSYDPSTQECDYEHYGLEVGFGWLFPGIVIGFIILVFGCCCVTCYGIIRKIPGMCQKFNVLNYTTPETCGGTFFPCNNGWICRLIFVIVAVLAVLLLLCALGVDVDVNNKTTTFREDSVDFADDKVDEISGSITIMQTTSISAQFSQYTDPMFNEANGYIDKYHDYMENTKYLSNIQLAKFITEVVFVFLMIILAVVGCCGAATGLRFLFICYCMMALISIMVLSLYYSYCIASEALYDDFCNDNEITLSYGNSALKYGILPCNGSRARNLRSDIESTIFNTQNYVCQTVSDACTSPGVYCEGVVCSLQEIGSVPPQIYVTDVLICGDANCPPGACTPGDPCYTANLTMPECAMSCLNPDERNLSNQTVSVANDAQIFADQVYGVFLPLLNCEFVRDYVVKIDDTVCGDDGMIRIGIVGLLTLLGTAALVLAIVLAVITHNAISEHSRRKKEEI